MRDLTLRRTGREPAIQLRLSFTTRAWRCGTNKIFTFSAETEQDCWNTKQLPSSMLQPTVTRSFFGLHEHPCMISLPTCTLSGSPRRDGCAWTLGRPKN